MGLPKRLTEMQMKFAHLLVTNEGRMNGYECAKEAGYSEDQIADLIARGVIGGNGK